MRIIYVDADSGSCDNLNSILSGLSDVQLTGVFSDFKEFKSYISKNHTDIIFICFDGYKNNISEIIKKIKSKLPRISIVFVSKDKELAYDALNSGAAGYLLKPFSHDDVLKILNKSLEYETHKKPQIFIRTIPYFDVYIDSKVFPISSAKAKELLALLVDRNGGTVSNGQVISYLWEERIDDDRTKALCRMTYKRLRDILVKAGIENLLETKNSQHYINTDLYDSDYKRILSGDEDALREYNGDYMSEYSWAEDTNARLCRLIG